MCGSSTNQVVCVASCRVCLRLYLLTTKSSSKKIFASAEVFCQRVSDRLLYPKAARAGRSRRPGTASRKRPRRPSQLQARTRSPLGACTVVAISRFRSRHNRDPRRVQGPRGRKGQSRAEPAARPRILHTHRHDQAERARCRVMVRAACEGRLWPQQVHPPDGPQSLPAACCRGESRDRCRGAECSGEPAATRATKW